jgi:arginyl-tRNA synthetase
VFELAGKINPSYADRCRHVHFGRILGMSTRKGNVVLLSDILDEAAEIMAQRQKLSPSKFHSNFPFNQVFL